MSRLQLLLFIAPLACFGCGSVTPTPGPPEWTAVRTDNNPSIQPVAVAVADMDGDGDLDVVSAWRGSPPGGGTSQGTIAVHFQKSPTSWTTVVVDKGTRYALVNSVSVADVDIDGNPDVLSAAMDRIVYLRAPADPAKAADWKIFEIAASIGTGFLAWFDAVAADIDAQNGLDIVAALSQQNNGKLVWLQSPKDPNIADGWILQVIDDKTRSLADTIAIADLDGDKLLDVVSSAPGEAQSVISWYKHPVDLVKGSWTKYSMSNFPGATRLALGDLNGDAKPDLAAISPDSQRLAWLIQPATVTQAWGGFVMADFSRAVDERIPVDVAIADIDADGKNEVVLASSGPGIISWFKPGTNNQVPWTETLTANLGKDGTPGLIGMGDINKDTHIDVIVPIDDSPDKNDRVDWFENTGSLTTEPTSQPATEPATEPAA